VIVALAACAWFAVGIRQAQGVARATSIAEAGGAARPGQLAAAASDLRAAAFLNPDQEVNILRGRVAILRGNLRRAREILGTVTRSEPMNLEAWIWFIGANLGNPPEARAGTARLAQLDPIDAGHARR
jgi:hypothetical protein